MWYTYNAMNVVLRCTECALNVTNCDQLSKNPAHPASYVKPEIVILVCNKSNQSITGHPSLSDGCTTPMELTLAVILDPVGWLMQLLCVPQIWVLWISGCGRYIAKMGSMQPSDEATHPWTTRSYNSEGDITVHQTWFAAAASLTQSSLQLSVIEQRRVSREEAHRLKPSIIRQA